MKSTNKRIQMHYRLLTMSLMWIVAISAMAVAPLPGLNLQEPARPRVACAPHIKGQAARAPQLNAASSLADRGLLIVVEFADRPLAAGNTILSFDSLANSDNYVYNGATGSCRQYYQDQSNGLYSPTFDVVGPVVLPNTMKWYGTDLDDQGNDRYVVDFIIDACKGADEMGVDFSRYDQDNDGYVDLVYVIYAGYSQAEGAPAEYIWPHAWALRDAIYFGNTYQTTYYVKTDDRGVVIDEHLPSFDGKTILNYACSNELRYRDSTRAGIGTLCHEFAHVLGLPDLYITASSASGDPKSVPGIWATMSSGSYLNQGNTPPNLSVWEKYYLGWVTPTMLTTSRDITMKADGADYYMLNRYSKMPINGPRTADTLYCFENRQLEGWDAYLPGHGMLVWRVVYDEDDWYYNGPNNTTTRFYLVTASGAHPYADGRTDKQDVPFPGSWNITYYTPYPHATFDNITEVDGVISMEYQNTNVTATPSITIDPNTDATCYNLLGQIVDPTQYHGIVICGGVKRLIP